MTTLSAEKMLEDCKRNKKKLDASEQEVVHTFDGFIISGKTLTGRQMTTLAAVHMKAVGNPDDHNRDMPDGITG